MIRLTYTLKLYVVPKGKSILFGRDWMSRVQLNWAEICKLHVSPSKTAKTKVQDVLDRHKSVFVDDWDTMKDIKAKLSLKPDAKLKFVKERPVAHALKERVNAELDKLVQDGVLEKVDYSEWATPIVPIPKKDGSVRVCGDFKVTVNPQLEFDQYPLPRIEAFLPRSLVVSNFRKLI